MILKLIVIAIMAAVGSANNYTKYGNITVECNRTHMSISLTDASQTEGSMMLHNSKEPQCYTNNTENWIIAVQLNSTTCSGTVIKQDVSYKVLVRPSILNHDNKYFYIMCKTGPFRGNVTAVSSTDIFKIEPGKGVFIKNQTDVGPTEKPPSITMSFTFTNDTPIEKSAVIPDKTVVKMVLKPDRPRYRIQPLKCTSRGSNGESITLIDHGCKGDYDYAIHFGNFNRVSGSEHEVNVAFNIFTFVDGIASLSFHCDIEVCDKDLGCDFKRCSSGRKKRAATDRNVANADGQLLVSRESSSSTGGDNDSLLGKTEIVAIGSSAGAMMLILVAMVIIFALRNRRRKKKEYEYNCDEVSSVKQIRLSINEDRDNENPGTENPAFEQI